MNISQARQDITYTSFNKTEKITEDAFELGFSYGPYDERVSAELKINSNASERRYYNGDYEKTLDAQNGNTLSEINYISCGSGLVAMFVKDPANPNGKMYYPYTDHLGSILTVSNETGSEKYEQSFDAWGRNRSPIDWGYSSIPNVPAWLYRGYTGHEHLPQFALINMNGRMYDPVVGRMLSPDVDLQDPGNTQSHNRYSYALNNPLKYTDPTGNNPITGALDILFSPFKFINAPTELATDRINGVHRSLGSYVSPGYIFGHQSPYEVDQSTIIKNGHYSEYPRNSDDAFAGDLDQELSQKENNEWAVHELLNPEPASMPSFPVEGANYARIDNAALTNALLVAHGIGSSNGSNGHFLPSNSSLGDFVGLIYGNAVNTSKDRNGVELSGFAAQNKKTGEIRYWINSQQGNTRQKSYNYEADVRKLGYKILFQLHSHLMNPPSPGDVDYQKNLGAEVFVITSLGDIWNTAYSIRPGGNTGDPIGDVTDYLGVLGRLYGIKK
jgi:RHS repeat-associated protein